MDEIIKTNKLIGSIYINILKDEKDIKFDYGYELDDLELSLNDLSMINSFLQILKNQVEQDFFERLEKSDKEFSIRKDKTIEED